jgi:hypothetical protein
MDVICSSSTSTFGIAIHHFGGLIISNSKSYLMLFGEIDRVRDVKLSPVACALGPVLFTSDLIFRLVHETDYLELT